MTRTTLRRVESAPRRWADLRPIAPPGLIDEIRDLASPLRGLRVAQINATSYGGGVAELLSSQIGLLQDAGIDAQWHLLCPDAQLFDVTKRMHNGMQGRDIELSDDELDVYRGHNLHCARMLGEEWDIVIIHDPQPAAIIDDRPSTSARWIWRCHIDTSAPDPEVWSVLQPYVARYDAAVFTLDAFRPRDVDPATTAIIAPAIDPLSTKNAALPKSSIERTVALCGLDPHRPLMAQVSRFDAWKDPLGVVAAWRAAREAVPGLQLALVGSMADDDPEGLDVYESVRAATEDEPDCHLLTNRQGIGAAEVNALQRQADVVVQKSTREGFGLTVSEALWKATPVVGGRVGGIPMQLGEDLSALLVDDVDACAQVVVALLQDPALARHLGHLGRERVRRQFLMPRLVRDELALYHRVLDHAGNSSSDGAALARGRSI